MTWKVAAVVGACAGGVVWALGRRTRRSAGESAWSTATDRVVPTA